MGGYKKSMFRREYDMFRNILSSSTVCVALCCIASNAYSVPLPVGPFVHSLWKMTGEYTRNGLIVSKQGITVSAYSDKGELTKCTLDRGRYFPGPANNHGRDGNFLTYVHLAPRYSNQTIPLLTDTTGAILKAKMPYYFLEATGEDHYKLLQSGQSIEYLGATPNVPTFVKPKVDEWFRVNCLNKRIRKPKHPALVSPSKLKKPYKAWIQLNKALLKHDGICRLSAASPDYHTGNEPTIHGSCTFPFSTTR